MTYTHRSATQRRGATDTGAMTVLAVSFALALALPWRTIQDLKPAGCRRVRRPIALQCRNSPGDENGSPDRGVAWQDRDPARAQVGQVAARADRP